MTTPVSESFADVPANSLENEHAAALAQGCDDFLRYDQPEALTPAALAGLPREWLEQLHRAVIICDVNWSRTLVNAIRTDHPAVARSLDVLGENFDYDPIIAALREALPQTSPNNELKHQLIWDSRLNNFCSGEIEKNFMNIPKFH